MEKQPVRMKAVVYALSPFQQKVMPGLLKDLPGKIAINSRAVGWEPPSSWDLSLVPTRMCSGTRKRRRWSIDIEVDVFDSSAKIP